MGDNLKKLFKWLAMSTGSVQDVPFMLTLSMLPVPLFLPKISFKGTLKNENFFGFDFEICTFS